MIYRKSNLFINAHEIHLQELHHHFSHDNLDACIFCNSVRIVIIKHPFHILLSPFFKHLHLLPNIQLEYCQLVIKLLSSNFIQPFNSTASSDANTVAYNNIVVFNNSGIFITSNLTGNSVQAKSLILSTPLCKIYDVAMSNSDNNIYFSISVETSSNQCFVTMFNGSINIAQFLTSITISATPNISKIVSKSNKVIVLINKNVMVFSYNATNLTLLSNQSLVSPNKFCALDISYDNLYLVANISHIVVYSLSNFTQLYSYSCVVCPITNAKFGFNGYVLLTASSTIYQLDLEINKIINQYSGVNIYVGWINSLSLFINGNPWPSSTGAYQFYSNDSYLCSSNNLGYDASLVCPSCMATYNLSSINNVRKYILR